MVIYVKFMRSICGKLKRANKMYENSNNQNFTSQGEAINRYILTPEQRNIDNIVQFTEAALDEHELEQILVEIKIADQEQEQLLPIPVEGERVSDLLNNHLFINSKTDKESRSSSGAIDSNTSLEVNNRLQTINQEIYNISHYNLVKQKPDEQLKYLPTQTCRHLHGSPQHQKLLTQIIRLISNKLWRESTPYYQDALQQTWLYFCRNVCKDLACQTYDPTYDSVVTWLNTYLKDRLQDFYQNREQATTLPIKVRQSTSDGISQTIDSVDNLPATPQAPSILEDLEIWAKTDSEGELRRTCIKGRPDVNCQVLILKRLPPEVSWKELSEDFGLSIPTLSSFYQRHCLPRLRKFAELEGFL